MTTNQAILEFQLDSARQATGQPLVPVDHSGSLLFSQILVVGDLVYACSRTNGHAGTITLYETPMPLEAAAARESVREERHAVDLVGGWTCSLGG